MSELQIRFGLEFLAAEFGSLPDRKKDYITSEKYYVQDDSTSTSTLPTISSRYHQFHQAFDITVVDVHIKGRTLTFAAALKLLKHVWHMAFSNII